MFSSCAFEWSKSVHGRLEERLHYYFLDINPYVEEKIIEGLESLIEVHGIGSIRANSVFGSKDLVLKTWLHPNRAVVFEKNLRDKISNIVAVDHVEVDDDSVSAFGLSGDEEGNILSFLSKLDREIIIDLQNGERKSLFHELKNKKIILEPEYNAKSIQYFLKVALSGPDKWKSNQIRRDILSYWNARGGAHEVEVHVGTNDNIVIEAKTEDYFSIARATLHLHGEYADSDTETFLCLHRNPIVSSCNIGESTFLALRGVDILVRDIIKEVYLKDTEEDYEYELENLELRSARTKDIINFITSRKEGKDIFSPDEKKLMRDYCINYLHGQQTEVETVIFKLFSGLERFLRSNLFEYIGRRCSKGESKKLRSEISTAHPGSKNITIGDLFAWYKRAMEICDGNTRLHVFGGIQQFVEVRNMIFHASFDSVNSGWSAPLGTVLDHHSGVQELISVIEGATGNAYDGPYFS